MSEQAPDNRVEDIEQAQNMAEAMAPEMDRVIKFGEQAAQAAGVMVDGTGPFTTNGTTRPGKNELNWQRGEKTSDSQFTPSEYVDYSLNQARLSREEADKRADQAANAYTERTQRAAELSAQQEEARQQVKSITHELLSK